jgi:hypothetical protein
MIGAMTIITTFISPYAIEFGWRVAEKWKSQDEGATTPTDS